MAKLIQVNGNLEIKKADAVVKARYKLNPLSLKFITTLIAGLKRSDDVNEVYQFKVKDFQELTKLKRKDLYWAVKETLKELLEKPLYIPKGKDENDNSFLMLNWVASAEYKEGEGLIEFEISNKLRPYLLEAQKKFLKYKLENILPLRSSYSIRMYEILKDWFELSARYGNKAEKIISLKEFMEILEIPKSYRFNNIKVQVLEKAKKELSEHTDIIFNYEEIKTGRKVTHIKFIILQNPAKIKREVKRQLKNDNDFKHFRQELLNEAKDKIIVYNDIVFKIIDSLLIKEDKILSKEEAWDWWQTFFKNKDKLKILDKNEFLKLQEEKVKEIEDIYKKIEELKRKYKYLIVNFAGKEKEATLADIQIENEKYKLFLNIENKTAINKFDSLNKLEFFLEKCNKVYKKRKS